MSRPGVLGSTPIVYNGPLRLRWNIAIVAEGFREEELQPIFWPAAQRVADTLLVTRPFDRFRSAINVYRIDVKSEQSGARDPVACGGTGAMPRTFFRASFCNDGRIQRALAVDNGLVWDVVREEQPQAHVALVLVNSPIWGGMGGSVATCSLASNAEQIALHELGHTYFGLGDEYDYWADPSCQMEPDRDRHGFTVFDLVEPNLTVHRSRDSLTTHKWGRLVAPATAVPTMTNPSCATCDRRGNVAADGTVGLYEGAHYYHCGAYRPEHRCKMRATEDAFCRVCSDQIARRLQPFTTTVAVVEAAVRARHSGKVLDVLGLSRANGGTVGQWDWWGGPNQRWRFEELGDGFWRIVSAHSGKVLDVSGVSRDNGAPIVQWDWWGGHNQQWRLDDVGGGFRRIVSRHSGKALEVFELSSANGARLAQWDWWGGDNQQFRLIGTI